jgi:hypothetical protein
VPWVFPAPNGGDITDPHAASRAIIRERTAFSEADHRYRRGGQPPGDLRRWPLRASRWLDAQARQPLGLLRREHWPSGGLPHEPAIAGMADAAVDGSTIPSALRRHLCAVEPITATCMGYDGRASPNPRKSMPKFIRNGGPCNAGDQSQVAELPFRSCAAIAGHASRRGCRLSPASSGIRRCAVTMMASPPQVCRYRARLRQCDRRIRGRNARTWGHRTVSPQPWRGPRP